MNTDQALDIIGNIIATLTTFSAKIPAQSFMVQPGGIRPTPEAVEAYEDAVYRFRDGAGMTYKGMTPFLIESLEAFETGQVFHVVSPLLQALEQLTEIHKGGKVSISEREQSRLLEFLRRLHKIFPDATKPEVDLPPPTSY